MRKLNNLHKLLITLSFVPIAHLFIAENAYPTRDDRDSPFQFVQVTNKRVEIFVTSWCPHCKKLEGFLKSNDVPYTRWDIETDDKARARHKALGGGGVPLILIDSRTVLRGFDPSVLYQALGLGRKQRKQSAELM